MSKEPTKAELVKALAKAAKTETRLRKQIEMLATELARRDNVRPVTFPWEGES